ncbi:hypothetical protein LZ554_008324 [Drepanopeziza brunnea f. sp. 'monogermtubi']|nr:hypothetical protein LZ554_008324 [Drepanopeziza brunnea f. sp. 'monogermtubi']
MSVYNHVVAEAANVIARNLSPRDTATPSSPILQITTPFPTPSMANNNNSSSTPGGPTSSPLLFFVALGFGVVFTNLWIIVGVKYCFRYNARIRAIRNGEGVDPISLENVPARPHRRRREKKLMSMDEVNERFPLTKYKNWVASRASEGLSTNGGVTAPLSRPASVREVGTTGLPSSPTGTKHSVNTRPDSVATEQDVSLSPATNNGGRKFGNDRKSIDATILEKGFASVTVVEDDKLEAVPTTAESIAKHPTTTSEEDDDDDDNVHSAVPPDLLANPGDSCAICIDALEDDDEIRGLTCGHAFHAGCLDPWLTARRACCPLCKADYYTPKPRPEGEAEPAERISRRARTAPQPPPNAFFTSRFMVPGRPGGRSRTATETRGSRRSPRHVAAAQLRDATTGGQRNAAAPASRRWVPSNPFRNMRVPLVGSSGRDRRAAEQSAAATTTTTTPSQLEAGAVR